MPRYDLKAYTSLTARIPQDLADQVKRYALEHRCGLSELMRDGLEMRLEADLPWHASGRSRAPDAEVLQEVLHLLEAVLPTLRAQLQATVRETLPEVLHKVLHREARWIAPSGEVLQEVRPPADESVSGPSVPVGPSGQPEVLPQQLAPAHHLRGQTKVLPPDVGSPETNHEGLTSVRPFDTTRYYLGKLCPHGHDYEGTGQSLRKSNRSRSCRACDVEQKRAKRQAVRQQEVSA